MDPNEALKLARRASEDLANSNGTAAESYAADLMLYFDALDQWLSRGGFLPTAWEHGVTVASDTIKLKRR